MFIGEKFVYVELPKTATTTVNNWLNDLVSGTNQGKHNKPNSTLIKSHKIIATIRNPWDWYLSLWSFGCAKGKKSGMYNYLTKSRFNKPPNGITINPEVALRGYLQRIFKSVTYNFEENKRLYQDKTDPKLFREWIKLVLSKEHKWLQSDLYAASNISEHIGFYTFQYAKLYCENSGKLTARSLNGYDKFIKWENENCYVDHFMKVESLEQDFQNTMHKLSVDIDIDKFTAISSLKSNKSRTDKGVQYFYDQETKDLVSNAEKFIIQKFGYNDVF